MSRKHYRLLAGALWRARPLTQSVDAKLQHTACVYAVADALKDSGGRAFNFERFVNAAITGVDKR